MFYQYHTLQNGIRLIHHHDSSPVVYCGFAVNVGSRDENEHQRGMAHFVEHMLFKGTSKRKSWHILNRLETIGGTIDAYTTKEETFVYAAIPSDYCGRAMELLSDILFHSKFPQHEIDKECQVIIDEIQSYNDTPSELIFDKFDGLLFGNSSLGQNILGNEQQLKQYTTADFVKFVSQNYSLDEMVFFSFGNIDFKRVCYYADKYFLVDTGFSKRPRIWVGDYAPKQCNEQRDTFQTHCIVGNRGYCLGSEKRLSLFLLNSILGGPSMNCLLNLSIREKKGLSYTIESEMASYTDTGSFTIYFGCDHRNIARCIQLVEKELKQLCEKAINATKLDHYKRQIIGQQLIASQNRENVALSMARSFLHFNHYDQLDIVAQKLTVISAEQLQDVANEIFDRNQLSILIFKG